MFITPYTKRFYHNFNQLEALSSVLGKAHNPSRSESSYPDYNIEQISENNYCIKLSLSGFKSRELYITLENNILLIGYNADKDKNNSEKNSILHQGIYKKSFQMRFQLADNVKVSNAALTDGILVINLEQEIPDSKKVRKIEISNSDSEAKKAA